MPELPEVETLRGQLAVLAVGRVIEEISVLDPKIGTLPALNGLMITGVARRAKELYILLHNGQSLNIHLRMTGRLQWQEHNDALPERSRVIITLDQGRIALIDLRRFATVKMVDTLVERKPAGEDIFERLNLSDLQLRAAGKRASIKSFLLNQSIMPGMGNIYACEILHQAGLHPTRLASSLQPDEWERIGQATPLILGRAISCRGTTVSDWRDLFGAKGENQGHLQVYGRAGLACGRCGGIVQRIKLEGRGTYFCPDCQ